jgi:hypothetical protein
MFTLQNSFQPLLPGVTVNNNVENFKDFCPNYVQEFGLKLGEQYGEKVYKIIHTRASFGGKVNEQ